MQSKLEIEFHEAMIDIYRKAKSEAGYTATRFLRMVSERGGLETAQHLIHAASISDGYAALCERKRLDLTVEALILKARWAPLFTDEERNIAGDRLRNDGGTGQPSDADPEAAPR